MFNCGFCGRDFTRKFNLERHLKSKHNNNNLYNAPEDNDFNENIDVTDDDLSPDIGNKNDIDDSDTNNNNKNNEDDTTNDKLLPSDISDFMQEFPGKKHCFDQRMPVATETIKSKFNAIRNNGNDIKNLEYESPVGKNPKEAYLKVEPEKNITMYNQLLQRVLDILLIKELQNVDIKNKGDEDLDDNEDESTRFKRSNDSVDEEEEKEEVDDDDDDEMKSPEEMPFKQFKYDSTRGHGVVDVNVDTHSTNSGCVERKYKYNPNTLVDELRKLENDTKIGQQIFSIIRCLNKINIDKNNVFENIKYTKERKGLIRDLNKLKENNIGHRIFCILRELEDGEIIERIKYGIGSGVRTLH